MRRLLPWTRISDFVFSNSARDLDPTGVFLPGSHLPMVVLYRANRARLCRHSLEDPGILGVL